LKSYLTLARTLDL